VNLEDNSELVKIGKQLHKIKSEKSKNTEISIESIKIDKIKGEYLIEYKKSNADIKASCWQVLFYLFILKKKGISKKGKLICMEKNKQTNKVLEVKLTNSIENILIKLEKEINDFINDRDLPEFQYSKKCRKCAYYSYCVL
jgi:CRISPR-associated exonuclease Cas4